MQLDNVIMQGAAPIMARAFADTLDVEVRFGSKGASTDGKVIYLPPVGPNRERARKLTRWFVGHEASHIKNTDMGVFQAQDPRLQTLLNVVEDIRIEQAQIKRYPGYRSFISEGVEELAEELRKPQDDDAWNTIIAYCLAIGYRDVLGCKGADANYALCVEAATKMFGAPFIQLFKTTMISAKHVQDTAGALRLARRLLDIMDDPPTPPPPPPPDDKDESSQGEGGQGGDGNEAPTNAGPDGGAQPESNDSGENGKQQTQAGQQSAGDKDAAQNAQVKSGAGQSSGQQDQGPDAKGAGGSAAQEGAFAQLKEAPSEGFSCIGDTLAQELNKEARNDAGISAEDLNYRAAPPSSAPEVLREVQGVSTRARMRCKNQLLSVRHSKRTYHTSGPRLVDKKVTGIALGDFRVFERIQEGIDTHCAVQVLLDASSSMSQQMALATRTALALANAMQAIDGMGVSVAAFPSGQVLLPFGAKVAKYSGTIVHKRASGGTPLAEAILGLLPSLLNQRQPRKLMLVVTDGEPNNRELAGAAIKEAEKFGVELVGVGIGVDIAHLIPASRKVTTIEELPTAAFEALTAAARKR